MFDYGKLKELQDTFKKNAFVQIDAKSAQAAPAAMPTDAGAAPPDAGAMPPDAGAMPIDAGAMPPDAGAMPIDAGAMPPDMAGLPPPPAPGGGAVGPDGSSMITMTTDQFLKFLKQMMALAGKNDNNQAPQQPVAQPDQATLAEVDAKLDALIHGGA